MVVLGREGGGYIYTYIYIPLLLWNLFSAANLTSTLKNKCNYNFLSYEDINTYVTRENVEINYLAVPV